MTEPAKKVTSAANSAVEGGSADTGPKYTTKCVYFPDKHKLKELENLIARYPRATMSTLIAQLVPVLADSIAKLPEGKRQIEFTAKIWI